MSTKTTVPQKTQHAAGPWQQGTPENEADYLIQYITHRQETPRISTGRYLPGTGWLNMFPGMQIIAYAEINPQTDE